MWGRRSRRQRLPPSSSPFPAADEGVRKKRNRKGGGGRETGGSGLRGRKGVGCCYSEGEGRVWFAEIRGFSDGL